MSDLAMYDVVEKEKKQYIVVKIGGEHYGIDISYIDNIVRMSKITRVPKAPSYYRGVINLRGEVVPVMSLRRRMNLDDDEFTDASRIIILKLDAGGLMGVIVDEVNGKLTAVTVTETNIADADDLDVHYQEQLNIYQKAFRQMTGCEAKATTYHISKDG